MNKQTLSASVQSTTETQCKREKKTIIIFYYVNIQYYNLVQSLPVISAPFVFHAQHIKPSYLLLLFCDGLMRTVHVEN